MTTEVANSATHVDINSTVTTVTTTDSMHQQALGIDQPALPADKPPKVTIRREDVETLLQEITAYSRANESSLKRGQLWLTPTELEYVDAALTALNLSSSWAFVETSPSLVHPPTPTSSQPSGKSARKSSSGTGSKKRRAGGSSSASHSKRKSATQLPGQPPTRTVKDMLATQHRQIDKESSAQRAQKTFMRHFKSLPDWARRLHRITLQLCQTDCAKPFSREPQPFDHDYGAIYDAIQPRLMPLGLTSVVGKLEQGSYASPLEAFNDIYSVFLAAYRTHFPGSPLWVQAHEASKMFMQQISNEPVRDDFTPAGTLTTGNSDENADLYHEGFGRQNSSGSSIARGKRSRTSVDKLFREFLEQHEGSAGAASRTTTEGHMRSVGGRESYTSGGRAAPANRAKKARTGAARQPGRRQPKAAQPSAPPITDKERETFQNYLSQLEPHHHLMLYEAFRQTAVWRSVETGEVELDDALISPPVFRKMISWCKSQVAVQQQPPLKRSRVAPYEPPTATPHTSAGHHTSSAAAIGPAPFAGSGKIGPDSSLSGGKLAAMSYIESRAPERTSPKYSSSGSSSSPSTSSSSDDDDNSDDDEKPPEQTLHTF